MGADISMLIKAFAEENGLSNADIARASGVSRSAVTKWFNGKSQPKADALVALSQYYDVPLIHFYQDEAGRNTEENNIKKQIHEVSGGPGRIDNFLDKYDDEGQLARVVGDSMSPSLLDGDVVRFVEAAEVGPTDYALVRIDGEALTVKHVEWTGEGLWIRAENKDVFEDRFYNVREIATIPVQIVGKAVEVRRML